MVVNSILLAMLTRSRLHEFVAVAASLFVFWPTARAAGEKCRTRPN
jgi:hypothetical protein